MAVTWRGAGRRATLYDVLVTVPMDVTSLVNSASVGAGQEPLPLRRHCAYSQENMEAAPRPIDPSGEHKVPGLSAHEPSRGNY